MTTRLKISVTDLDQLLWYDRIEDMSLEQLVDRFKPTAEPSPAMALGTSFHAALEEAAARPQAVDHITAPDGTTFDLSQVDGDIPWVQVPEFFLLRFMTLPDGTPVRIGGKVDGATGLELVDHKLTGKWSGPETYFDSYQWRLYLWLTGFRSFRYNVFVKSKKPGKDGAVQVTAVHPIQCYRYPGIEADCLTGLSRFAAFATAHLPWRFFDDSKTSPRAL